MQLSPELTRLLTAALRSRSLDAAALAEVTGTSLTEVQRGIESLRHLGYLGLVEGAISYRRPELPVIEATRDTLTAAVGRLTEDVTSLQATLGTLPALLQAWEDGALEDRTISADVVHGPAAPAEAWMHHFARDTPGACDLVFPDFRRLLATQPGPGVADWATAAMADLKVRVLVSRADAHDPALRPALRRVLARGTEVRWHAQPPSLFWVSERTVTGLPFHWGEAWPTSVVTVRSTPVVEVAAAVFDQFWRVATPLGADRRSWEPMLVLMDEGMTIEAAASKLGLAPRTARRRVADAMQHYGVSSQFALGAAWGRSQES